MELRPVSQAVEDYVKAIYLLEQSEGKVTTKALALALDVAAPSVTAMIKRHFSHGVTALTWQHVLRALT